MQIPKVADDSQFGGGQSTVRQYLGEHDPSRAQVVIPLEHDPGETQIDRGVGQVIMTGRQTSVRLFCFQLCYSQKSFVMAFPTERKKPFFAGHVVAFSFIALGRQCSLRPQGMA
jgi:transposase